MGQAHRAVPRRHEGHRQGRRVLRRHARRVDVAARRPRRQALVATVPAHQEVAQPQHVPARQGGRGQGARRPARARLHGPAGRGVRGRAAADRAARHPQPPGAAQVHARRTARVPRPVDEHADDDGAERGRQRGHRLRGLPRPRKAHPRVDPRQRQGPVHHLGRRPPLRQLAGPDQAAHVRDEGAAAAGAPACCCCCVRVLLLLRPRATAPAAATAVASACCCCCCSCCSCSCSCSCYCSCCYHSPARGRYYYYYS